MLWSTKIRHNASKRLVLPCVFFKLTSTRKVTNFMDENSRLCVWIEMMFVILLWNCVYRTILWNILKRANINHDFTEKAHRFVSSFFIQQTSRSRFLIFLSKNPFQFILHFLHLPKTLLLFLTFLMCTTQTFSYNIPFTYFKT